MANNTLTNTLTFYLRNAKMIDSFDDVGLENFDDEPGTGFETVSIYSDKLVNINEFYKLLKQESSPRALALRINTKSSENYYFITDDGIKYHQVIENQFRERIGEENLYERKI